MRQTTILAHLTNDLHLPTLAAREAVYIQGFRFVRRPSQKCRLLDNLITFRKVLGRTRFKYLVCKDS